MPRQRKSLDESAIEFFQSSAPSHKEVVNSAAEFVKIESICLPQQQPRRYFDSDKLKQLTQSVKEHGILEPLLVRPVGDNKYELVAGERRYQAAQILSLKEIPVVVKELGETEALQLSLVENLQREDLNPVEETEGLLQLLALKLESDLEGVISLLNQLANAKRGFTDNVVRNEKQQLIEEVFATVGRLSVESFRTHRLPLLNLSQDILEALRQGKIEYTKAKAIASLKDEDARKKLMASAIAESLSLREIKERIKAARPQPQKEEIFDRMGNAYKQVKKSKKFLMENPRKKKKLESLLAQIEKLLEVEK